MTTQLLEVKHGQETLEIFVAFPEKIHHKHPTVLIYHPWAGRSEFCCNKAIEMAQKGYIGIALDLYGKGKIGTTDKECQALMAPFIENRKFLKERMAFLIAYIRHMPNTDINNIVGIGYCFGGLCVLDCARTNLDLKGAVSVHGLLNPPPYALPSTYTAKVLAFHGYKDPLVSQDTLIDFQKEMDQAQADMQFMTFSTGYHAFTNPKASDKASGFSYDPLLTKRTDDLIYSFLKEVIPL